MAKITFIGTSASIPSKNRDNTSFVFSHKQEIFLVDCPGGVSQKLLKAGIDFRKIKNVIITHHHPDHIYGIASLIHTQAFSSLEPINIFTNATSARIIKKLIKIFNLDRAQFPPVNLIDACIDKPFYATNNISLQSIPNIHTSQSFGVKFSFAKKTLFYSSDTAFSQAMLNRAAALDYLVHDCTASSFYFSKYPAIGSMHTSSLQLARYLRNFPRLKLIPVHFLSLDRNEEQRVRKELSGFKRQILWVYDGQKLII